jgi:ribosomal protein S18 acetylase RimI-like enzyme
MKKTITITAQSNADYIMAKSLIIEYGNEVGVDLFFQDFEAEIEKVNEVYKQPANCFLLLIENDKAVGCAGIRVFKGKTAELKRMYIKAGYRGKGLGSILLEKAITQAKEMGYEKLRLDTLPSMQAAQHLYRKTGFYEIASYRFNPVDETKYFELDLKLK